MSTTIEIASGAVIADPRIRRGIGVVLYLLSLAAGIAALTFSFFPELAFGTDIPSRAIGLVNGVVSLLSGAFGLVVTVPNVPRTARMIDPATALRPPC